LSNCLKPKLESELREAPVLALAHVGDAVFELMVRTWLYTSGTTTAKKLHNNAVEIVSAKAQAVAAESLLPHFDEDEHLIFKRGRNTHVNSVPRGSSVSEYHAATGLETLFGYLYLSGKTDRLEALFMIIMEDK